MDEPAEVREMVDLMERASRLQERAGEPGRRE
jgi:hypothetical protein